MHDTSIGILDRARFVAVIKMEPNILYQVVFHMSWRRERDFNAHNGFRDRLLHKQR